MRSSTVGKSCAAQRSCRSLSWGSLGALCLHLDRVYQLLVWRTRRFWHEFVSRCIERNSHGVKPNPFRLFQPIANGGDPRR